MVWFGAAGLVVIEAHPLGQVLRAARALALRVAVADDALHIHVALRAKKE